MKRLLMSFLFVLMVPGLSYADSTEEGTIAFLLVTSGYVKVHVNSTDDISECTSGGLWTIDMSQDSYHKQKLAMLFLAYVQNKTVKLWYYTTDGCGAWNSRKIRAVSVTN